jgi:uncharacterized protein
MPHRLEKGGVCSMQTVALLTISNVFMTLAWYGHLKFKEYPLFTVILASWGIAFIEYCFQVPANRIGHAQFSAAQLKTIQEVITLVVFSIFSVVYLKEAMKWNYVVGFALIVVAVFVIFKEWE